LEVDRDAVREVAAPEHPNAQALAHRAVGAVGGDQVRRADELLLAGVAVADDGPHTVLVLLEVDQLGGEAVLRAASLRLRTQDGLQTDLRDEQARFGAEVVDALVDVLLEVDELLAT